MQPVSCAVYKLWRRQGFLLSLVILAQHNLALCVFAQISQSVLAFAHAIEERKASTSFNSINGDTESFKRRAVWYWSIGQYERGSAVMAILLGHDDFEKVRRDGNIGRIANDLVFHIEFAVRFSVWQVQRTSVDIDVLKVLCEITAKVFQMSPVWTKRKRSVELKVGLLAKDCIDGCLYTYSHGWILRQPEEQCW